MPHDSRDLIEFKPQPGPQTDFLASDADVVIYGGAAGGGKSYALLLEPLRHYENRNFGGVVFRRDREQVTNEGGLWDESFDIYPHFAARPNMSDLYWTYPSGASMGFAGLQYDKDVRKWQGSQIPFMGFDELTHFTEFQFFYMLTRNRSAKAGFRSYIRATTNPDADSWVRGFIDFWIDPETGLPIPERAGVIRYLVRDQDRNFWFDSRSDAAAGFPHLAKLYGNDTFCKSVTFIPADIFDNPALIENDPAYLANLLAAPLIDRERLLKGNWNVKATAGKVYNREWFPIVDDVPPGGTDVRFFDLAATEKKIKSTGRKNDPDFTATVKMRYYSSGIWIVTDAYQVQTAPANVEKLVFHVADNDRREAKADGATYACRWEREPGSASKRESQRWATKLRGIDARGVPSTDDKLSRARNASAQAEAGNIKILNAPWVNMLLANLHGFPDLPHDDLFDAFSGAFNESLNIGGAMSD